MPQELLVVMEAMEVVLPLLYGHRLQRRHYLEHCH